MGVPEELTWRNFHKTDPTVSFSFFPSRYEPYNSAWIILIYVFFMRTCMYVCMHIWAGAGSRRKEELVCQ